jgi:hypothetical protein
MRTFIRIGIDLAKNFFQVQALEREGAPSSANTEVGTGRSSMVTESFLCPSVAGAPTAKRRMSSPIS